MTDRATLVVIVTPQSAPSDGANDPANQVLLAIAQEFATASAVTVVAGNTTGSAQAGSAISVLRSSSVSSQVSTVDNADTTLGQITVDAGDRRAASGRQAEQLRYFRCVRGEPVVGAVPDPVGDGHTDDSVAAPEDDAKGHQPGEEEVKARGAAAPVARGAVAVAVAGAGAARVAYAALKRHPPGGEKTWQRTNHRGEPVTLLEGPAVAAGCTS